MGGITITCEKCKKVHRYDSSEIDNIGTAWHAILTVKCPKCRNHITWEMPWEQNVLEQLFDKTSPPKNKNAYERAESSDIREFWIREYVKDNYTKLGFSEIEGPFEVGPDFKGIYKSKKVTVEIERDCQSYILHKHHKDKRFEQVDILIVLNPSKPSKKIINKLPKTIIYINIDDFVEWWRPKAKDYAKIKRIQRHIDLIAHEFQKRFIRVCKDKNRDMSTCPECDLCPYFGEGIFYKAHLMFQRMASDFIYIYKYPITSDDFSISIIKPSEINEFFNFFTPQMIYY